MKKHGKQTAHKEFDQSVMVLNLIAVVNEAVNDWLVNSKKECSDNSVQDLIDSVIADQVQIKIEGRAGKLMESPNGFSKLKDPHGWRLLNNYRIMAEKEFYRDMITCKKNARKRGNTSVGDLEIERIDTDLLMKIFFSHIWIGFD